MQKPSPASKDSSNCTLIVGGRRIVVYGSNCSAVDRGEILIGTDGQSIKIANRENDDGEHKEGNGADMTRGGYIVKMILVIAIFLMP